MPEVKAEGTGLHSFSSVAMGGLTPDLFVVPVSCCALHDPRRRLRPKKVFVSREFPFWGGPPKGAIQIDEFLII